MTKTIRKIDRKMLQIVSHKTDFTYNSFDNKLFLILITYYNYNLKKWQ